jgi:hypothetical protein
MTWKSLKFEWETFHFCGGQFVNGELSRLLSQIVVSRVCWLIAKQSAITPARSTQTKLAPNYIYASDFDVGELQQSLLFQRWNTHTMNIKETDMCKA